MNECCIVGRSVTMLLFLSGTRKKKQKLMYHILRRSFEPLLQFRNGRFARELRETKTNVEGVYHILRGKLRSPI